MALIGVGIFSSFQAHMRGVVSFHSFKSFELKNSHSYLPSGLQRLNSQPTSNKKLLKRNCSSGCRKLGITSLASSPLAEISPVRDELSQWQGLAGWRSGSSRNDFWWGKSTKSSDIPPAQYPEALTLPDVSKVALPDSLSACGRIVLLTEDPLMKASLTHKIYELAREEKLSLGTAEAPSRPGRPLKPELVHPRLVPQPGQKHSPLPRAAHMLHNLAHVELNAIDLAWDTLVRFSPHQSLLGWGFFRDFLQVADDESRHLGWCIQRLSELGFSYGDMPAHDLLWRDCQKTAGDVQARLALIPMIQEARGLDAGPRLVNRLQGMGDNRSSSIVSKIAEEELAHVAVGVHWFAHVCVLMNADPENAFMKILSLHNAEGVRGPFNHEARALAGIPRHWYDTSHQATMSSTPSSTAMGTVQLPPSGACCVSSSERPPEHLPRAASCQGVQEAPLAKLQSEGAEQELAEVHTRLALLVAMESDRTA